MFIPKVIEKNIIDADFGGFIKNLGNRYFELYRMSTGEKGGFKELLDRIGIVCFKDHDYKDEHDGLNKGWLSLFIICIEYIVVF